MALFDGTEERVVGSKDGFGGGRGGGGGGGGGSHSEGGSRGVGGTQEFVMWWCSVPRTVFVSWNSGDYGCITQGL